MKGLVFLSLLLLTSCGGDTIHNVVQKYNESVSDAEKSPAFISFSAEDQFVLPALNYSRATMTRKLWATYYYTHVAKESDTGEYLRNKIGQPISPKITNQDWCKASLEGSILITQDDGKIVTYTYHKSVDGHTVICHRRNRALKLNARFKQAQTLYGETAANEALRPYRSIAVDRSRIALGTVLYIPKARGMKITLPDGSETEHDGYFYATDTGSGIKDNQIDVYIGIKKTNPFGFVKSRPSGSFDAYIVKDLEIIKFMKKIHQVKSNS